MIKFWTIAITIFIAVAFVLAKFSLKKFRKDAGEKTWKLWDGRATYWQLLSLFSFGITIAIMLIMHFINIPII